MLNRSGLLVLLAVMLVLGGCGREEGVKVIVETPLSVYQDATFPITLIVRSTDGRPKTLTSITFDKKYLEAVEILSSDPEWLEEKEAMFTGDVTFVYDLELAAAEKLKIQMLAEAVGNASNHDTVLRLKFGLKLHKQPLATKINR